MRRALPLLVVILFAGCVPSGQMVMSSRPAPMRAQPVRWDVQLEDGLRRAAPWFVGLHEIAVRRPNPVPTSTQSGRRTAPTSIGWDVIAACESGGDWSYSGSSGFEGGLQFTHSTWIAYGGREFAEHAYDASREAQITVAERVLTGQGLGAWPVCGRRA